MIVDLAKTARPSKIQPKVFQIFKEMQKSDDSYLVVVDGDNRPMGAIVSPAIIQNYINTHQEQELKDFSQLAKSSFSFWDNSEDDIYDDFYSESS